MRFEDFLAKLDGAKQRGSYYIAKCPAHQDDSPSLSVKESEGKILLKCHAKCSAEEIVAAMALQMSDLMPEQISNGKPAEIIYLYTDASGAPLFRKTRKKVGDKKSFFQEGYRDGDWIPNKQHLGLKGNTLYNLPAVLRAIQEGKPVYINEGEKACDELSKKGAVGTCQPAGAGDGKWRSEHTTIFKGAHAVIVADRDAIGESYAQHVAGCLKGVAASVKVVRSKTAGNAHDAYDHLKAGFSLDELLDASDLLPVKGFRVKSLANYAVIEKPAYLWEPYIPDMQLTLLDADGGVGKTTMVLAVVACLSRGMLPGGQGKCEPIRTIYFGSEDEEGDLRAIFEQLGGDSEMFFPCSEPFKLDDYGLNMVEETIAEKKAKLFVFDALFYYLAGVVKNTNDALEVAPVLAKLREIARRQVCAGWHVRHTAKGTIGKSASDYGMGSVQFRNSHRSQLLLRWHPDKQRHPGLRICTHEKGNIRTPTGPPIGWSQGVHGFCWVHDIDVSCFDPNSSANTKPRLEEAKQFLLATLTGRYVSVVEVNRLAEDLGIKVDSTLKQARKELDVKAIKANGTDGWLLHLPRPEAEEDPYEDC